MVHFLLGNLGLFSGATVDGKNPANQLILVVFPMIYQGFRNIPGDWPWGFLNHLTVCLLVLGRVTKHAFSTAPRIRFFCFFMAGYLGVPTPQGHVYPSRKK